MTVIQTVAGGAGGSGGEVVDLSDAITSITGSSRTERYMCLNYGGKGTYSAGGYTITSNICNSIYISESNANRYRIGVITQKTAICNALKNKLPNLEDGEYWISFLNMGCAVPSGYLGLNKLKLTVTNGSFNLSQYGGTDTIWIYGNAASIEVKLGGLTKVTT